MAWPTAAGAGELQNSYHWYVLLNDVLFVNFYWGLLNLLPVYPLDGGHAARAVCVQRDPYRGTRNSLILSAAVASAVALLGVVERSLYMVLMFCILAASSMQSLDVERRRRVVSPRYRSSGDNVW